jgi:hypothetical protein
VRIIPKGLVIVFQKPLVIPLYKRLVIVFDKRLVIVFDKRLVIGRLIYMDIQIHSKSFSPGPLKNNHKIYGTNKFEKLKKLICMVE